ncbi:LOW QUALITY PROTEIN: hypothetical protein OSB04_031303 [Centaurea solstitialis]|uniref:Endonuclease/exonuclease/phosphatase domain-containing protein n=1 Tax=Centaurea solstitialis TaxID=347529 RepID=A0AA38SLX0_9ASTR|nr:LOW QUALITY PROTEIN: hypothetical protein OSB04_031303 [Centaurea solstitialis]
MKLLSVNCRGLGSDVKKGWIRQITFSEKPDLVGIQEMKMSNLDHILISRIWGGDDVDFTISNAQGSSGGIVTFWDKKSFSCTQVIQEEDVLAVIGSWLNTDGLVGFVNICAKFSGAKKRNDLLHHILSDEDVRWCVFGDFNEIRDLSERLNSEVNYNGMRDFVDFINNFELIEVPLIGRKFTRISNDGTKFSKLDRFLMTEDFSSMRKKLKVKALDRGWSDHVPIVLEEDKVDFGPIPFKFFDSWLLEDDLGPILNWKCEKKSDCPDRTFRDKLKGVKTAIKTWSKSKFGSLDSQIEEARSNCNRLEKLAETKRVPRFGSEAVGDAKADAEFKSGTP